MKTFFLIALSSLLPATNAFTTPRPHGLISAKPALSHPSSPTGILPTRIVSNNNKINNALEMWSRTTTQQNTIEEYTTETMDESNRLPASTKAFGGFALLLFSGVCQQLQMYLNEPCLKGASVCTEEYFQFATFFKEHEALGFGLLLTHAIPFALIPYTMAQISKNGAVIQKDHEGFNPFVLTMAFACTAFGLALEFGWHVADSWYYANDFHVLNFGFYFFLISSFALWADGLKANPKMDVAFGAILLFATALYPAGNAISVGAEPGLFGDLLGDVGASTAKIPLYIGMTVTFASITARGKEIFGNKMWMVFFLSVVVNLGFIFILDGYEYGNNPELSVYNYIYHICHDVLGTEAGVFYFATLIRDYVPLAERREEFEA